jgi:DNA-binding NtrC family response regulator
MEKLILLIDDDEDELDIFNDALNKLPVSFTCSQVRNTEEAMQWLNQTKPAFIFIDYNMPKANGIECLAELKKIKDLQNTDFIIYSDFPDDTINEQALAMGASVFMKKPNLTSTLAHRLKEILLSRRV